MKMRNIVMRICLKCKHIGKQDDDFSYLGDGVWACNQCLCKYTEVSSVVEQAIKDCSVGEYQVKVEETRIGNIHSLETAITLLKFAGLFLGKAVAENLMQDQILTPQRLLKKINDFLDMQESKR
jgi:hypothetical protein